MLVYLYNVFSGGSRQSLSVEAVDRLFSNDSHSPLLKRRRARVILSRVRFLSLLCVVAFPIGFLLDFATFDVESYVTLGITRALMAILFLSLFFGISSGETLRDAYRALGIFFAILLTFQTMYQPLLDITDIFAITSLAAAGYLLFPFLIVGCIAIFPFTVKEAVLTLILFFVVQMFILILMPEHADPHQRLGILLTLMVTGLLCVFAAISQLLYISLLIDQASIDSLTQCYSRNSGEEIIDVQFKIAKRQNMPFSLVFVDLDNFKAINDRYGHEAGDRVLANAAASIRRNARGSDVIVRWGGEEFVILLPNTDAEGALKSIRRLRNIGLGARPDGKMMTASFGIVDRQNANVGDWSSLVDIADNQMYDVKSRGGNDIAVYDPAVDAEAEAETDDLAAAE
ncbi:GGDEF domain-containing protein [Sneathiella sp.]|uniref:GGDEF domain-containing protein n=1 Tax=Sneathiella sp. TaxID=1964365 RepID=UPI00262EDA17|nr:GGDEF domain-containing protein [Sneathiella sp.]MDF2366271.1 GGDEF domain-containing protein [Sneathiella sp.]